MPAEHPSTAVAVAKRGPGRVVAGMAVVWLAIAGVGGPAVAEDLSYERFAFDVADTDGDGLISEAEFVRDAAAAFSGLDADRSGTLTPDELGPHDPRRFTRIDTDNDGALTFTEVMSYKMRKFREADIDGDGALSFKEMYDAVAAEWRE